VRIRGVDSVWAMSSDMERSVKFYRDDLGLPSVGIQDSDWKEYQVGNVALCPPPERGTHDAGHHPGIRR
jgi:catechol 2,3-dioxygenase-like lactoylglutathione lyase family enzyme